MDASISIYDQSYDKVFKTFDFDIAKFSVPLAFSGIILILASILGFVLARTAEREYGVAYGMVMACSAAVLFTFSHRLTNIIDPKNV